MHNDDLFQDNIVNSARMTSLECLIKQLLEKYQDKMDWISCVGGNLSVTKKILIEAGGFDEGFGLEWGCEDIELGFRLMTNWGDQDRNGRRLASREKKPRQGRVFPASLCSVPGYVRRSPHVALRAGCLAEGNRAAQHT